MLLLSHFPHLFLILTQNAIISYVATGDSSGLLRVWPLDFKEHLMQAQHDCGVAAIAVSSDDLKLAVSTVRGTLGEMSLICRQGQILGVKVGKGQSALNLGPMSTWNHRSYNSSTLVKLIHDFPDLAALFFLRLNLSLFFLLLDFPRVKACWISRLTTTALWSALTAKGCRRLH